MEHNKVLIRYLWILTIILHELQSHLSIPSWNEWARAILACMHGVACIELPYDGDEWDSSQTCMKKLQPALYDIAGWSIQARITRAHSFYLGIDDFDELSDLLLHLGL